MSWFTMQKKWIPPTLDWQIIDQEYLWSLRSKEEGKNKTYAKF